MPIDPVYDPRATTLPVLRYLVALDRHRHFGRAAEACRISQPTLSAQIGAWERRMGVALFERSSQGVRPTPLGERVVAAAHTALAALAGVEAAAEARPPFHGPVRLGVIPTAAPYVLPFITRALARSFPSLDLPIREATTSDLLADLAAGRIDVAFLAQVPALDQRFTVEALYHEPFLAALPRGHALARARTVEPQDLAQEPLLLLEEGHCLRDQAQGLCQRLGQPVSGADYRATSLETLRHLVAAGAGVTLLPVLAAGGDDPRVVLRPLTGDPGRTMVLAWRTGDPRSEAYTRLAPAIRTGCPWDRVSKTGT